MDINDILKQAKDLVAALEAYIAEAPPPPPSPAPAYKIYTVNNGEKSLANFINKHNDAGFPVMMIYPKETILEGRITFGGGKQIKVEPVPVKGDGNSYWYKIVEELVEGVPLYLNASKGTVS
jgi:hypothetical protein